MLDDHLRNSGFSKHKMVYIRVINDVCQSFYIEKLHRGSKVRLCRVGFSVLPLAQRISKEQIESGVGLYYLRKFERQDGESSEGWVYKLEDGSIDSCAGEISRYIADYLLPFFNRASDTKTALSELIALEELFYKNRTFYQNLSSHDISEELGLLDGTKYCLALKNKNFDYAKRCAIAILNQNVKAYESAKDYLSFESIFERKQAICRLRCDIEHIESRDYNYFCRVFSENEDFSRCSLKKYIVDRAL